MGISRRSFVVVAAATIGVRSDRAVAGVPPSARDLDDLVALGEVLVADEPLSREAHAQFREQIGHRAGGETAAAAAYPGAGALLRRLAGTRLATLDDAARRRLVRGLGLDTRDRHASTAAAREVRERLVPELITAFYACPAGWAIVGYTVFPGRCGDLGRYTGPEP